MLSFRRPSCDAPPLTPLTHRVRMRVALCAPIGAPLRAKDYYEVLGVSRNSTQAELKRAFYKVRMCLRARTLVWLAVRCACVRACVALEFQFSVAVLLCALACCVAFFRTTITVSTHIHTHTHNARDLKIDCSLAGPLLF